MRRKCFNTCVSRLQFHFERVWKMNSKVLTKLLFLTCSTTSTTNKLRLHSHARIFSFVTWLSKSNLTRDTFSSYVWSFCWSVYNSLFSWECYYIMFISVFIRKYCILLGSADMSYSNSNNEHVQNYILEYERDIKLRNCFGCQLSS